MPRYHISILTQQTLINRKRRIENQIEKRLRNLDNFHSLASFMNDVANISKSLEKQIRVERCSLNKEYTKFILVKTVVK